MIYAFKDRDLYRDRTALMNERCLKIFGRMKSEWNLPLNRVRSYKQINKLSSIIDAYPDMLREMFILVRERNFLIVSWWILLGRNWMKFLLAIVASHNISPKNLNFLL